MAYSGYLKFDDVEIVNVARTEKYASTLPFFKPVYKPEFMEAMLGDDYGSPLSDMAPWVDPDHPESFDFYGVYPLEITGFEDSTRETDVFQFTTNGGNPGRVRLATRGMVVSAVLVGREECALDYGFGWLKRALLGQNCAPTTADSCWGRRMRWLNCEPSYDPTNPQPPLPPNCPPPETDIIDGGDALFSTPDVIDGGDALDAGPGDIYGGVAPGSEPCKAPGSASAVVDGGSAPFSGTYLMDGGASGTTVWECTAVGGDSLVTGTYYLPPYPCPLTEAEPDGGPVYAPTTVDPTQCMTPFWREFRNVVITGGPSITGKRQMASGGAVWTIQFTITAGNPDEFGEQITAFSGFLNPQVVDPFPIGVTGEFQPTASVIATTQCTGFEWQPYFDPNCPALVGPPDVPDLALACWSEPSYWYRRWITADENLIPLWSDAMPYLRINADQGSEVRGVRIRFYQDNGSHLPADCGWVGEFIVTYIPQGVSLIIDSSMEITFIDDGTGRLQRADSLVISTNGKPIEWFGLTCGVGYVVAVDTLTEDAKVTVDLDLIQRVSG